MSRALKIGAGAGAGGAMLAAFLMISDDGIRQIEHYEGTKQIAYADVIGVHTICTGHTRGVRPGDTATFEQCRQYLHEDLSETGRAVGRCVKVKVTQGQYDAMMSLAFNIGATAFCGSTLVRKLNAGDCDGAANQFARWNRADGRVVRGLTLRRLDEAKRFREGCARENT